MELEQPIFVKSAQISAHLHFATEIAKRLSMTAKNARVITVRAGIQASGYTAITTFIEELSRSTLACSQKINAIAVEISRVATERVRAEMAQKDFIRVTKSAKQALFIDSLNTAITANQTVIDNYNLQFSGLINDLIEELEESKKQIRTADILVSTAKIEASKSGTFEPQLNVIAANLAADAKDIKFQIKSAEKIIDDAKRSLYASH